MRCVPRLVPATACTSSRITVATPPSISRPEAVVISRLRLSGVVISTSGGRRNMRRRSAVGVSPLRTATRTGAGGAPALAVHTEVSSESGVSKLRSTSLLSALSGDT